MSLEFGDYKSNDFIRDGELAWYHDRVDDNDYLVKVVIQGIPDLVTDVQYLGAMKPTLRIRIYGDEVVTLFNAHLVRTFEELEAG